MEFRGFAGRYFLDVELPYRFQYNRTFQSWADNLFEERSMVWESTNQYLIQEGWIGLTKDAINRMFPVFLCSTSHDNDPGLMRIASVLAIEIVPNPPVGMIREVVGYRYRRIAG